MTEGFDKESGWRGSRQGWLQAAHEAFVRGGLDAVTIRNVSAGLRLSRSSFYWHFQDRNALVRALVALWEEQTTGRLIAATQVAAPTETQALLTVMQCFLHPDGFDQTFEFAMRSSALVDNWIMDRVKAADVQRMEALRGLMQVWGHDEGRAEVRAQALYMTQIGYISMQIRETTTTRLRRLRHYVEVFSGRAPSDAEFQLMADSLPLAEP